MNIFQLKIIKYLISIKNYKFKEFKVLKFKEKNVNYNLKNIIKITIRNNNILIKKILR